MSRRYTPTPLHRMLAHLSATGLGHRPDPDDAGRHFSQCPVCGRLDALVVYEPDDYLPVRLSCRSRCHPARLERALADGLAPDDEQDPALDSLRHRPLANPALLRRQGELLIAAAEWLEQRSGANGWRAAA